MLALAFDTSSPVLTIAIGDQEKIINDANIWLPRGHMAKLIPAIDELLNVSGLDIGDIEVIVIGSGPGSYTGLRIGMVMARTFAQMLDIPIIGIPSLDAIANHNKHYGSPVCPVTDAKRGEVYTALYQSANGATERIMDFRAVRPDELADVLLIEGYGNIVITGDALKLYSDVFARVLGDRAKFASEEDWWPRASDLIDLARPRVAAGDFDDLRQLLPIYVRLSQAEEMWEKRHRG
ncbi:MAG: tRNA (adenosine(37)-N6)-threonylcarbamoyltransferase complex dimerization subunit type 1 TsaB [Firmicutes bacterium]|nr:tRNA (adenosine(37)-N6)-threonylcarbamoyltransferase complex dimerization subunit type 1 TsaB [Bacillota bacterium]